MEDLGTLSVGVHLDDDGTLTIVLSADANSYTLTCEESLALAYSIISATGVARVVAAEIEGLEPDARESALNTLKDRFAAEQN